MIPSRADHGERHEERDEVDAERLVSVERRTGRLWIMRDQLEVREKAVMVATMNASRNGSHTIPPTVPAMVPVTA